MEPLPSYNDALLCRQIAGGDERAFRALFDGYRSRLFTYLLRLSRSPEQAEDLVHDIFLDLWTRRAELTGVGNLNAYLHRMAHNKAVSALRRRATETLVLAEIHRRQGEGIDTGEPPMARSEVMTMIAGFVGKMDPKRQKIFILSREQGLSREEIAAELGMPVNTVRWHLVEALRYLRQELTHLYGPQAIALFVLHQLFF